jgi:hypothetical protein
MTRSLPFTEASRASAIKSVLRAGRHGLGCGSAWFEFFFFTVLGGVLLTVTAKMAS